MSRAYDLQLRLLHEDNPDDGNWESFNTAPILTGDAFDVLGADVIPQQALYGQVVAQHAAGFPPHTATPMLYINTNTPFSAVVCGVQGSGKSHSTSVLLESCLIAHPSLGTLPEPLSALVFHFDTTAGSGAAQPCEAAYLAVRDAQRGGDVTPPTVTVLVLPSNLRNMRRVYANLPGVEVKPLHFASEDISGERLLSIMRVDENTQMPLYMESVMDLLRSLEGHFDYGEFREKLEEQNLQSSQRTMLNIRLQLLDSCLKDGNLTNHVPVHFGRGKLTIIDLSSPFMDGSSACGFFDLILGLFIESKVDGASKLVVLDEAHKYLSELQSGCSSKLTDSLLKVIRQQRHLASRVVISTQEPTVVPTKFIDLCSFVIAHRFQSPSWLRVLLNHVSVAEDSFEELSSKVMGLGRGEAIIFAPNGLGVRGREASCANEDVDSGIGSGSGETGIIAAFGKGYLHVKSRLRVTQDGGQSILAVKPTHLPTARAPESPRPTSTRAPSVSASATPENPPPRNTMTPIAPPSAALNPTRNVKTTSNEPKIDKARNGKAENSKAKNGKPEKDKAGRSATHGNKGEPAASAGRSPKGAAPPKSRASKPASRPKGPETMWADSDPSGWGPSPEASKASEPANSVISLTGDRQRFHPLVEFIQSQPYTMSLRSAACEIFGDLVDQAVYQGLLSGGKSGSGSRLVKLVPGATYNTGQGPLKSSPPASAANIPSIPLARTAPPTPKAAKPSATSPKPPPATRTTPTVTKASKPEPEEVWGMVADWGISESAWETSAPALPPHSSINPPVQAPEPSLPVQPRAPAEPSTQTPEPLPTAEAVLPNTPSTIFLKGDNTRFRPLIEFLVGRGNVDAFKALLSKQFGGDVVQEALARHLVIEGTSAAGTKFIKLLPDVSYSFEDTSGSSSKAPQATTQTPSDQPSDMAPPAGSDPSSTPSTVFLTGDNSRFRPLVEFLQSRGSKDSWKNLATKQFGDDIVSGALSRQLLIAGTNASGVEWVRLMPDVNYAFDDSVPVGAGSAPAATTPTSVPGTSIPASATTATASATAAQPCTSSPSQIATTIQLTDDNARFASMVRYLLTQRQSGNAAVNVPTLYQRVPDAKDHLENAVAEGIVQVLEGKGNKKVALQSGVTFVF